MKTAIIGTLILNVNHISAMEPTKDKRGFMIAMTSGETYCIDKENLQPECLTLYNYLQKHNIHNHDAKISYEYETIDKKETLDNDGEI